MKSYFNIPEEDTGYLQVLKQFRIQIPLATRNHYQELECIINGNLPEEIKEQLPIFGIAPFIGSNFHGLNSGGRGVILSDGKSHLRFKGIDLDSSITRTVGNSPVNHIMDIAHAADKINNKNFDPSPLDSGKVYSIPGYGEKPFSFFHKESVNNEKIATEIINKEYNKNGFFSPYTFIGSITYPRIKFRGRECSTLVFSLPSAESDLRFEELNRLGFLHLKFASKEELIEVKEDLCTLLENLTQWHGFSTRVLHGNNLAPTENSHQYHNYVICHVKENEIGLSRVDHTSTVIYDNSIQEHYRSRIMDQHDHCFMGFLGITLLHALALESNNYKLDEDRYTGYLDNAYKWQGKIGDMDSIKFKDYIKISGYINKLKNAFDKGYKNKEADPIPQERLITIMNKINNVRINHAKQQRVNKYRE